MQFGRRRFKDRDKPRSLPPLERLAQFVISIITIVAAITLLLTIISPFIEPSKGGVLPILGLFAPATYVTNILLALYWIIYWRWRVALPIIIVLTLGGYHTTLFIKVPLTKEYDTKSYRSMSRVMSYNLRSFYGDKGEKTEREVAEYVEGIRPDIICFQEFHPSPNSEFESFAPTIAKYNRAEVDGVVLLSRYPIISSKSLIEDSDESTGRALMADVVIGSDTVRVFNNHLESTTITKKDNRYLTSTLIVRDSNRNQNILDIISRYRSSCERRAKQVDIVSYQIALSPYPTIVCGDFNDTPASYTYFKMSSGLKDAFQECGNDYSYTFRGFFDLLRIDYILCSKEITPHSYKVDREALYSDHLPVISYLKVER